MRHMLEKCYNPHYLSEHTLPSNIHVCQNLVDVFTEQTLKHIIVAVPSRALSTVLPTLIPYIQDKALLLVSKGLIDQQFLDQMARELISKSVAVLSGPSFANEVALRLPTSVVIAADSLALAAEFQPLLASETFHIELSTDLLGVQLGGAYKNVLAIAIGISDGLNYGANARCALLTRGVKELLTLGKRLGADSQTLVGFAGLGDLVLTCTDNQSRNRRYGKLLGGGLTPAQAEFELQQTVEGTATTAEIINLADKYHIQLPIVSVVWQVLQQQLSVQQAGKALFNT